MRKIILFLFCIPLVVNAQQSEFQSVESELINLSKILLTDTIKENRIAAAEDIDSLLQATLVKPGAFAYPFDSIQGFSILQPEDKSFRIFTWQLYEDVNDYRYYGIIQMSGEQPKIAVLNDQSGDMAIADLPYEILDKDNWYGALYYGIKQYDSPNGRRYMLYGFDGFKLYHRRKLADVLFFENDQPTFGDPAFFPTEEDRPDLALNRLVLTYGSVSVVRLNFDEYLGMIIYDHLLEGRGMLEGEMSFLPDGSYRGYELKKGRWIAVDKIFDHTYDTAPRPEPILNGRRKNKDVFGNE